jgi:hypothetical protein
MITDYNSRLHRKDTRMTSTLRPRSIPNHRIIVRQIETETLLYDESTHRAWCVNRSSACVWQLCDGNRTVKQIAEAASRELECAVDEDVVLLTLDELREKNLLEEPSSPIFVDGISRRKMIARAGLAAAALLPVIGIIAAPPAARALSGGVDGNSDGSE